MRTTYATTFVFLAQCGLGWDSARLEDAGRFVAWLR
jgi:hypothetical protein